MRKPHLDFLALAARLLEGFGIGESANVVSHILVDVTRAQGRHPSMGEV